MGDWSFFYSLSFFIVFLACLEFFCLSVLEFACFLGLSMLPSYCGRVLIALRAYADCKYFVPNTRKSASGKEKWRCPSDIFLSRPKRSVFFFFFSFFEVPFA